MAKPNGRLGKTYRIMWDQNAGLECFYNPPMDPAKVAQAHFGHFEGTPVDAYVCALGCNAGYIVGWPTKVKGMEFFVDRLTAGKLVGGAHWWRAAENLRLLWEDGIDPVQVQIDEAARLGVDFWFRLSMNDWHHYEDDTGRSINLMGSSFFDDHPSYRIGPDLGPGMGETLRHLQDYAHPEVRRLRLETAVEACERYDVTGFEYDFMRCPLYFKHSEVNQHIPLMTEFVRQTRAALDAVGEKKGHPIGLSVRVPNTIAGALNLGLDVPVWIKEDLVDIVVPSTFFNADLEEDISEWVTLAEGTPVRINPAIEEAYSAGHTGGVNRCFYSPPVMLPLSREMVNAIAARHWRNGADGLYVFNWFGTSATYGAAYGYDINVALDDIGNPLRLKHKNKRYVVMRTDGSFPNCLPHPRQLPATIGEEELNIHLDVADDLAAAGSRLRSVLLSVNFKDFTVYDRVEIKLSGKVLTCINPRVPGAYDPSTSTWQNYNLRESLPRVGDNVITFRITGRNQRLKNELSIVITDIELEVEYDYPNGPWVEPPGYQPRT